MDKNKSYLLEVLSKKGLALCEMYTSSGNAAEAGSWLEEIQNIFSEIVKFVEPSDSKVHITMFPFVVKCSKRQISLSVAGYQVLDPVGFGTEALRASGPLDV